MCPARRTNRLRGRWYWLAALVLLGAALGPTYAAEATGLADVADEIRGIEQALASQRLDEAGLKGAAKRLTELKAKGAECVSGAEKETEVHRLALEQLGEPVKGESSAAAEQRRNRRAELTTAEAKLATCKAVTQRVDDALALASKQLQAELQARLFARGPHIGEAARLLIVEPVSWDEAWQLVLERSWTGRATPLQWSLWFLSTVMGLGIGWLVRSRSGAWVRSRSWGESLSAHFAAAVMATASRQAPYLIASAAAAVAAMVLTRGWQFTPLLNAIADAAFLYFLALFVIRAVLCPVPPGRLFVEVPVDVARRLATRLHVLAVVLLIAFVAWETVLHLAIPESWATLLRTGLRLLFAVNIVWVLWLSPQFPAGLKHPFVRHGLAMVLVVAVAADLLGYSNLSGWLIRAVFGTLLATFFVLVAARLVRETLEGLEYGRAAWQRRVRENMGLVAEERIPGFFWLRLLVTIALWTVFAGILIQIWDLSESALRDLNFYFQEGFTIGSLRIVPARVVLAVVSLGMLIALSAWLKRRLEQSWLAKLPIERGAREALVTMTGYVGAAVAILVALGVAGLEFTNLAIIAGALSVGIGFGLQNIVNNFVSGLILLFERPVKTGDWIVVGGTEGYVRRISIRSTQIETFDRADVIVPNSELISGQVVNWMLRDPRGRARIPVGVAYGSDTAKVKELLLNVARSHDGVITDGSSPEPTVLFLGFGDSSLNFELRCHVFNVDSRLRVISDLNFAIDAAFREHGVEIPFPQRDLHMRDWPVLATDSGDNES